MRNRTREWSLRTRLLVIAALASLATLVVGGAVMYWAAQREDGQLLDSRLEDLARTVLSFSEHEITEILGDGRSELMHVETAATLGSRYRYQIWTRHGTLLLRSYKASPAVPMAPLSRPGFSTVRLDEGDFRVFAMEGNGGEMVIQVAEGLDQRESAIGVVSLYFIAFLLLPFALIFGVTWWLLRRSLRSIDTSAAQLSQRSPIDLTPLVAEDPPTELKPMIRSINVLFERINRTLSLERGFTAVAAHELRTPLAGLRAQAQVATLARTPEELATALNSVMSSVDRASHLLDQLLDLARVEAAAAQPDASHRSVERGRRPRAPRRATRPDIGGRLHGAAHRRHGVGHAAVDAQPDRQCRPLHTRGRAHPHPDPSGRHGRDTHRGRFGPGHPSRIARACIRTLRSARGDRQ
jgi:signal transduction histidine kinase